jgi:YesN/AraC family two-component response regulator
MFTMLVVDDERLLAEGMRRTIDELGLFQTFVAKSGTEALSILDARRIDAMLLDIAMPEMNGIELMMHLKERPHRPATIIISGYEEFDYAKQALSYGAADYVLKPVVPSDVRQMAKRLHALVSEREDNERLMRSALQKRHEGDGPKRRAPSPNRRGARSTSILRTRRSASTTCRRSWAIRPTTWASRSSALTASPSRIIWAGRASPRPSG